MTITKTKSKKKETLKFKLNEHLGKLTPEMREEAVKNLKEQVKGSTLNSIRTVGSSDKYEPGVGVLLTIAKIMNLKLDDLVNK